MADATKVLNKMAEMLAAAQRELAITLVELEDSTTARDRLEIEVSVLKEKVEKADGEPDH